MIGKRYEIARLQSDFYRDRYHALLRALLISVGIMWLLIIAVVCLILIHPKPLYYASTTEGLIVTMAPRR